MSLEFPKPNPCSYNEFVRFLSDEEILDLLGHDLDRPDLEMETILGVAISHGRYSLCKSLLEHGCNADLTFIGTDPSETCLQMLHFSDGWQFLELLFQYSCFKPWDQHHSGSGTTLLHQAVSSGKLEWVPFLFAHGARLDDMDIDCETVRMLAIRKGGKRLLKQLEENERKYITQ